jgi:eight-cysteine-cluster-containing protein
MKRIILGLLIFILIFQIFLVKNVYADSKETVNITGKVKLISIEDAWLVIKTENGFVLRIWNAFKRLIGSDQEAINEYRVNIMSDTKIEDSSGKIISLDNIVVGEVANVTGILLENMTKTESGLIEAQYIKIFKSKTVTAVITSFFNFNNNSSVVVGQNDGEVVTSNLEKQFGVRTLPTKPKVFKSDECVFEGEPILVNALFAPKVNDKCCEGLQECLLSGFKANGAIASSDSVIELNGFSYIVKGYCRKECSKDDSDNGNNDQSGLMKPGLPEIPKLSVIKQCKTDYDCSQTQKCVNGFCVNKKDVTIDLGMNKSCFRTEDCVFNGIDCETRNLGILNSLFNLFSSNNQCNCINNICSVINQAPSEQTDNTINCGSETFEICGVDGKTYNNPCEALKVGVQIQCNKKCPCETTPEISEPDLTPRQPGKCSGGNDCTMCGDECFDNATLTQLKNGGKKCEKTTVKNLGCYCQNGNCMLGTVSCGDTVDFVCGDDNKTYKNTCEANDADVVIACRGKCPCDVAKPIIICPVDFQPVCGMNNKSYNNPCLANKDDVDIKCNGVCPCSTTTTTKQSLITPNTGASKLKDNTVNGFCGVQTESTCLQDSDCMVGGCSGEICQAKNDNINAPCLFTDCYQKPDNVYCGCDNSQCK